MELKVLKGRFEDLAERVLKKKIDRGSAAVAGQLLAQARMCVRDGLLAREQEELIQEVQEVKRDLEAERQRNRRFGA